MNWGVLDGRAVGSAVLGRTSPSTGFGPMLRGSVGIGACFDMFFRDGYSKKSVGSIKEFRYQFDNTGKTTTTTDCLPPRVQF